MLTPKIMRTIKWTTAIVLMALLIGCAAKPQQFVWANRIGKTTYQEVISELGPPDRTWPLSSGGFVAEWVTRRPIRSAFSTGSAAHPSLVAPPSTDTFGPRERVLRLSFNQEGKLTDGRETVR